MRYIVIDSDAGCLFKTDEITKNIEEKIMDGYYRVIDIETMESIASNKNGLFSTKIEKY